MSNWIPVSPGRARSVRHGDLLLRARTHQLPGGGRYPVQSQLAPFAQRLLRSWTQGGYSRNRKARPVQYASHLWYTDACVCRWPGAGILVLCPPERQGIGSEYQAYCGNKQWLAPNVWSRYHGLYWWDRATAHPHNQPGCQLVFGQRFSGDLHLGSGFRSLKIDDSLLRIFDTQ